MTGERGFTVVELLVASGVLIAVLAAAMTIVQDAVLDTPVVHEAGDLHQRARVAVDRLAADLAAAGGGTVAGRLESVVPVVLPRATAAAPATVAAGDLTIRFVSRAASRALLAQALAPEEIVATIDTARCPVDAGPSCGFVQGARTVLLHAGLVDAVTVTAISGPTLTLASDGSPRASAYPPGSVLASWSDIGYSFDAQSRQLRRTEGGGTFPLVDHVASASFDFLDAASQVIPLAALGDGPFLRQGSLVHDADLLRVRTVRAVVTLETPVDLLRGTGALFARPGTATGRRTLPDISASIAVALRTGG